jgi:cyclophilin family peptidyl-prolyl cis-trans isomerase
MYETLGPAILRTLIVLTFLITPSTWAQPGEGLFAVFTTSQGEFTCELYFKRTPRTVANFISLAEGSRSWVNFSTAKISNEPYYDQTTFHRVMKDFVIQGGSPNGMGTDGPGYRFRDELHQELKHDRSGILSMAKTGQSHTNGSQFFVTLAPTPWLDENHSVFGAVVEGQEIVDRIGQTPTGPGDRPIETQMIETIRIVRSGSEAEGFDVHAVNPPLPSLQLIPTAIQRTNEGLDLTWDAKENHNYHVFFSDDFRKWGSQTVRPIGRASLENFISNFPNQFFLFIESDHDLIPIP